MVGGVLGVDIHEPAETLGIMQWALVGKQFLDVEDIGRRGAN